MSSYHRHIGRRMIAQLPSLTLAGVLVREDKDTITLKEALATKGDWGEARPVDGEVVIERQTLLWSQVI